MNKRTFQVDWESPGNLIESAVVIVRADNLVIAQDKFLSWLKTQPVYNHMWKLNFAITEVTYVSPEVIE